MNWYILFEYWGEAELNIKLHLKTQQKGNVLSVFCTNTKLSSFCSSKLLLLWLDDKTVSINWYGFACNSYKDGLKLQWIKGAQALIRTGYRCCFYNPQIKWQESTWIMACKDWITKAKLRFFLWFKKE